MALRSTPSARAATDTWTGAAGDGLWSSAGNWSPAVPTAADTALFNIATSTAVSLNAAAQSVKVIDFDTSVGSFTFNTGGTGGVFNLTSAGSIALLSTATSTGLTETFNTPISLGGSYTFTNSRADTTSALVFNGNVTNTATSTLTLSGGGTGTGNLIAGNISDGTGVQSLAFTATAGKWTLSGANSYSGLTNFNGNGALTLSGTNSSTTGQTTTASASGTLVLNNASNGGLAGGQFNLNGGAIQSGVANLSLSNNFVQQGTPLFNGTNGITINGTLTNSGGNRTLTSSIVGNTLTLAGNVYLSESTATGRNFTINGSGKTLISGIVADAAGGAGTAGSLTLNATAGATVTLTGANTYSGGTTLTLGILVLGQSSTVTSGVLVSGALGTGTLALGNSTNAILQDNGTAVTVANSVTTSGTTGVGSAGTGSLIFDGTGLSTPATFALGAATTLAITNSTTINDVVSGAFAFTKTGTGTLTLSANNTFSGLLTIGGGTTVLSGDNTGGPSGVTLSANGGTLDINNAKALGTGTFTTGNNVTIDNTSSADITLSTNNAISLGGSFSFTGTHNLNFGTGGITLTANPGITINAGTLTFGGAISGAHSFTKGGVGTLVLGGADTFTGAVSITGGALNLQNSGALGTGSGASSSGVTISSGGALQLQGGISTTTAVPITSLNGAGVTAAPNGAVENVSGTNTYSGAITLAAASTIGSDAGTLTLSGGITNAGYVTTFAGAGNTTVSTSAISGTGGVVMAGTGTLTLAATNSYTGTTLVNGGALLVNGSTAAGSIVTVSNTGTLLGGTGTINGRVSIGAGSVLTAATRGTGGTVTAANVGTLNTGMLTLTSGAVFHADVLNAGGTAGSSYDQVNVTGTVGLGSSTLELSIAPGLTFTNGQALVLINNDGTDAITGTFAGLAQGGTISAGGYTFTANYAGGTGNDFELDFSGTAVPEPSTYFGGLLLLAMLAWNQRARLRRVRG